MPPMSRLVSTHSAVGVGLGAGVVVAVISVPRSRGACGGLGRASGGELVAGLVDGGGHLGRGDLAVAADRDAAGGQVHGHVGDAGQGAYLLLDGGHAVAAGHAGDLEGLLEGGHLVLLGVRVRCSVWFRRVQPRCRGRRVAPVKSPGWDPTEPAGRVHAVACSSAVTSAGAGPAGVRSHAAATTAPTAAMAAAPMSAAEYPSVTP